MQKVFSIEDVYAVINKYFNRMRASLAYEDFLFPILYTLYGIHKQYSGIINKSQKFVFEGNNDSLLNDLYIKSKFADVSLLYRELIKFPYDSFNKHYPEIICYVCDHLGNRYNKSGVQVPSEMSLFISQIIKGWGIHSLYNPFCGMATHLQYLDTDIKYVGQDIQKDISIIARVNNEAHYGIDANIYNSDSILNWNYDQFDAVFAIPPFGIRLSKEIIYNANTILHTQANTKEELLFFRAFEINNSNYVITLLPISFCFSQSHKRLREYLVNNNLLDKIITFPQKTLIDSSVQTVLVICKKGRDEHAPIYFYDASQYSKEVQDEFIYKLSNFEWIKFIDDYQSDKIDFDIAFQFEIKDFNYNLNPLLYINEMEDSGDGKQYVKLHQLASEANFTSVNNTPINCTERKVFQEDRFSRNFIEILLKKDLPLSSVYKTPAVSSRLYCPSKNETYLLSIGTYLNNSRFALYNGQDSFSTLRGVHVLRINEDLVNPEYLAYLLINNPLLKKIDMPLEECMKVPIIIANKQKQRELIDSLKRQAQEALEANQKRLGVKQNISDLEHMLGSTQFKINNIISRLEKITPESSNYNATVKALRDNVNYLNRVIRYSYEQITPESFNKESGNIAEFIKQYSEGWKNYGGKYFSLDCQSDFNEVVNVRFDQTMLTVLFDSILSNAARHGFHKRYNVDNRVQFSLSLRSYNDKPYVLISVANNGDPFDKDFGLSDYISKGRYSSDTGRSGLGGYHVFSIVKGHDGFLYIDSNYKWNVIIDILLPIENTNINNLIEYEHECI